MHLPDPEIQPDFYRSVTSKRFFAWVLDSILIAILVTLAIPFTAFTGLFFLPVLFLLVGFAYRFVTIAAGSATFGMRFMGIELRDSSGARLDGGTAFLHTLGYSVSMAIPVLQLISVVLMLTSTYGQGLTDSVLGTFALNKRARF